MGARGPRLLPSHLLYTLPLKSFWISQVLFWSFTWQMLAVLIVLIPVAWMMLSPVWALIKMCIRISELIGRMAGRYHLHGVPMNNESSARGNSLLCKESFEHFDDLKVVRVAKREYMDLVGVALAIKSSTLQSAERTA